MPSPLYEFIYLIIAREHLSTRLYARDAPFEEPRCSMPPLDAFIFAMRPRCSLRLYFRASAGEVPFHYFPRCSY